MNRTCNLAQGIANSGERLPFFPPCPQFLSLLRGQPALASLHTGFSTQDHDRVASTSWTSRPFLRWPGASMRSPPRRGRVCHHSDG